MQPYFCSCCLETTQMLYTIFININPYLFPGGFPCINLMEVIKSRRSTRAFKSELPPKDQIMHRLLKLLNGRHLPAWASTWHFTVIYNAEKSLKLARAVADADNRGPEYRFLRCAGQHHHLLQARWSTTLW